MSRYGTPFLIHTYFHHVSRIDHRHNFSPYNTLLYLTSAIPSASSLRIESLAFLPQLLLSCVLIPLALAKRDLATSMMAQTFAFVTFNKVCTSQVRLLRFRLAALLLSFANTHLPVFPLVYGLPTTIPPLLVTTTLPQAWRGGFVTLGRLPGRLAAARVSA